MKFSSLLLAGTICGYLCLTSCSSTPDEPIIDYSTVTEEEIIAWNKTGEDYKNPFPEGSYKHFLARADYPFTYDVWKDKELLAKATPQNTKIKIILEIQRGLFYVNGKVAMDYPVSTGVKAFPTKPGNYTVIQRSPNHVSNLYGTIYNAENKAIKYDADSTVDSVPEGGRFDGAKMPNFLRLTNAGLGLHVGKVRRAPASHGCIRLLRDVSDTMYAKTKIGTPVIIVE